MINNKKIFKKNKNNFLSNDYSSRLTTLDLEIKNNFLSNDYLQ